ncbi:MAG: hypoxanthine phosphoribosyltransferase [Fimbriimonadaceae bacterium]|nr:hypoxanthine phosphoribosyltransferase [Fimbriimonadaceae bacterium]
MSTVLAPDIAAVLLDEAALAGLVAELAAQLNRDYGQRPVLLLGVLNGACIFVADLVRRLRMPLELDFVGVASYGDAASSSGQVTWTKPPSRDLAGREVLLVEDIVDTGVTLRALQRTLLAARPASLATVALLSKPARRQVEVPVEYLGIAIPDEFVVGYGLDYAQAYRQLPYVGILRREVWEHR